MRVKLLTMSYSPTLQAFDDRPLAEFTRDKQVLAVREHFFVVHDMPLLACLVTYQEAALPATPPRGAASVAPTSSSESSSHDLTEQQRVLYATLRTWRADRARTDGIPPYLIFTNRQFLALVRELPTSAAGLQSIEGVGPAKVERFGAEVLAMLQSRAQPSTSSAAEATS